LIIDTGSGNVAQALEYDEWGNILSDTYVGAVPLLPFRFAGGLYDADTKLIRFGARDYDPETGRWTAKDPIRFDGDGTNLYGYTQNDPVNFVDLLGLSTAIYDPDTNKLIVYSDAGVKKLEISAYNNVTKSSKPFPSGFFQVGETRMNWTPKRYAKGYLKSEGFFFIAIYGVDGRIGMGIHAGRNNPKHVTHGCIRISNNDLIDLVAFSLDDPIKHLIVNQKK